LLNSGDCEVWGTAQTKAAIVYWVETDQMAKKQAQEVANSNRPRTRGKQLKTALREYG